MDEQCLTLAAAVIEKADREHRADEVLRLELKKHRDWLPDIPRSVSRAVFGFYRWRGWLDSPAPLEQQVRQALEWQERFRRQPNSISEAELRSQALPGWLEGQMPEMPPAWLRDLQTEPRLWLRARPGQAERLRQQLGDMAPGFVGLLSDALSYEGSQDLFRTPEFHAGEFEVQDLSSQAVGCLCAPLPGDTWWDACAGEGGKMLHLADLMQNRGLIWASDRAEWRLARLKRRAARARLFNYRMRIWDGGSRLPTRSLFDGVLVDAPCSGIGAWQRNPHARWTTTPQDVEELSRTQQRLLAAVAPAVKPGGKLVYSVCTLTQAETVGVATALERERPEFEPWPLPSPLDPGEPARAQHWFWPQDHGGNGMFVAVWRRKG